MRPIARTRGDITRKNILWKGKYVYAVVNWWNQRSNAVMMTSSNGNIFRLTGLLWEESTGHITKARDTEILLFLWSTLEQTVEQTIKTLVIFYAIALIRTSLWLHWCAQFRKYTAYALRLRIYYSLTWIMFCWSFNAKLWSKTLQRNSPVIILFIVDNNTLDDIFTFAIAVIPTQVIGMPVRCLEDTEWNIT